VIESLTGDFDPDELKSEYRRDLRALLEAKAAGQEIPEPEEAEEPAPAVDLMAALKASVEAAKKGGDAKPSRAKAKPKAKSKARAKAS
jgi:DNA end-binding protein Ku